MKKIILATFFVILLGLFVRNDSLIAQAVKYIKTDIKPISDSRCLKFKVKFNASSQWRENGKKRYIMAGCDGQGAIPENKKKLNPPGCTGGLVKIKPYETATLGRCSCFFVEGGGCLKIGKELTIEDKITGYKKRREVKVVKPLTDTAECSFKVTNKKRKVLSANTKGEYICGTNEQKKEVNVNVNCRSQECPKPGNVANVKVTCPECKNVEEVNESSN